MECYVVSTAGKTVFTNQMISGRIKMKNVLRNQGNMAGWSSVVDHQRLTKSNRVLFSKNAKHHVSWRLCCKPVSVEEGSSSTVTETFAKDEESMSEDSPEEAPRPLSSDELKALLADSERSKLIKKLSEANQQNRFLKRQLQTTENSLISFKSELATMDLEIQALVNLAEEIANYNIPDGSRKINGKYIQSHLLSRLQVVQEKMKEQIKDVEAAQPKEVPLFWSGVAEGNLSL
ncbi:protein PTST, chloroplastic isoform X5 [Olea europaea var. sylvestris]|uniref:protein PTST, chloroplastic isoform X5 n=1 Tax=Olea europaea var. sylvestris TaxID=158386 RepID=UPI000C1D0F68|nr:protein PTST, chloroplastic isoform X5 [Olea europaea var. sylvestris]